MTRKNNINSAKGKRVLGPYFMENMMKQHAFQDFKQYRKITDKSFGDIWNIAEAVVPFTEEVENIKNIIQDFYADTHKILNEYEESNFRILE